MFVLIAYDVNEKRVNKIRKLLKKYLIWTQNSLFEGEITEGKLNKCLFEIEKLIVKNEDSVYVYTIKNHKSIKKNIIGNEKNCEEIFL